DLAPAGFGLLGAANWIVREGDEDLALPSRLHVPVEEGEDPVDRSLLDMVGTGGPVGRKREGVAVQRVIPRHPFRVLAALFEELVAEAEDPLEMVGVPAH